MLDEVRTQNKQAANLTTQTRGAVMGLTSLFSARVDHFSIQIMTDVKNLWMEAHVTIIR